MFGPCLAENPNKSNPHAHPKPSGLALHPAGHVDGLGHDPSHSDGSSKSLEKSSSCAVISSSPSSSSRTSTETGTVSTGVVVVGSSSGKIPANGSNASGWDNRLPISEP